RGPLREGRPAGAGVEAGLGAAAGRGADPGLGAAAAWARRPRRAPGLTPRRPRPLRGVRLPREAIEVVLHERAHDGAGDHEDQPRPVRDPDVPRDLVAPRPAPARGPAGAAS